MNTLLALIQRGSVSQISLNGGDIMVPYIGIRVGTIGKWQLKRRGDEGPDLGLLDLHASLLFVVPIIWEDPEYEKEVTLDFGRGSGRYKVEQGPDYPSVLTGRMLVMEGVTLCQLP